uniref:Sortase n=1 Tax=Bellilinea caldifistulae TaxID=360411 RepID=A0A7C4Q3F5_9CHLR
MRQMAPLGLNTGLLLVWLLSLAWPTLVLAAPRFAAVPSVSINAPGQVFIGSSFSFTVTFDNTGADTGYGPYLDVFLPLSGADGIVGGPNDGISFSAASYLGAPVTTQTLGCPAGSTVTHPLTNQTVTCPAQPAGLFSPFVWQMVVVTLPFGSFVPGQPPIEVAVNAQLSNYADLNVPLPIWVGGGFMFGQDPLNNPGSDPPVSASRVQTSPNPTAALITLSKTYSGPEDETATGPNFPRRYTVTATIAAGQTLSNFVLSDSLPGNMQFVSLVSTSPGGASCSLPSTSTPGGSISCSFGSVSGSVSLTFEFFIPLRDANGNLILDPATGDDVTSCNNAAASGNWTPLDPRDSLTTITQNPAGCEHTLTDKSIAIQKGVANLSASPLSPGDVLEYTLDIQISDFFVFDQVVVTDVLSDGQRWDASFTPTLQIAGNPSTLYDSSGAFNSANYTIDTSQIGNSGPNPPDDGTNGTTTITFRISNEIISRGQDGRLIGGCVPPGGTGGVDSNCGTTNDGPTTARIVFRAVVQEEFSDTYPSGDASVDQNDVLTNTVSVGGRILSNTDATTPTGYDEEDTSASSLRIPQGSIAKSIYALNGNTDFSTPVRISPGDVVTYRVRYDLQTSDFEDLVITDYLPLPIFNAAEVGTFSNTICGIPIAGNACLGPASTYHTFSGAVTPTFSTSGMSANNSLTWNYGRYDSAHNAPSTIDLLFSVTVRTDPFADGLFLTNQANGREGSTNSTGSTSNGIVQVQLQQPVVSISKGVVWSNNAAAQFSPAAVGPITFNGAAATCAARLGETLTSGGLTASPVNSNVSNVDAGDTLMMAVILENTGRYSAYDVQVRDSLPAGMTLVSGSLCVTDGTGDAFTYTGSESSFFSAAGITLVDPGPTATPPGALDPGRQGDGSVINDGRNIAVITYLVTLDSSVDAGSTLTNIATLLAYAGAEGAANHVPGGLSDDARTTIANPAVNKQLTATEINDASNSNTQAVIGELVTYTVTLTVPEGDTPGAQLVDTLDSGLAFVDCQSISNSAGVSTDLSGGFSAACSSPVVTNSGRTVTFNLGNITNANTDNAVAETITLTYRAVVLNVSGNQAGTLLNNSARLSWSNGSVTASAPNVTVIEPVLQIAKSVSPTVTDAGNTVAFTVTLTNPVSGSTTAYDVQWSDTIPGGLSYVTGSLNLGSCTASTPPTLNDAGAPALSGSGGVFQPGQSCTITFDATVQYAVSPGQTITNTAEVRWSSLSGTVNDRSPYNTDSDERDGSGGVNDYLASGSTNLTIQSAAPGKYLMTTSEVHTGAVSGTQRVAIGEIVRYRIVVQLPEGSSPNFQIRDLLPAGLQFLDDGTTRFALVADGVGISSSGVGIIPAVNTASCTLSGTSADATTPSSPLPCILPDANIGSDSSTTADPDNYGSDVDVYFKFGSLINNDNDADGEFVVVEFNALVLNIGANTAGTTRGNQARVLINGSQNGSDSSVVNVTIAEPDLTISKAQTSVSDGGDTVTYTLTITAASGGTNRATAFDLTVSDALDSYLTPNTTSVTINSTQAAACTGNGGGTTPFSTGSSWSGNTLTVTATCLDPGSSITVTFSATVNANVPAGYTIPNTANLTYTSLPGGNGTTPNPTGSTTPGTSGSGTGERQTNRSATVNQTLAVPQISKESPAPTAYPIGATVTYPIRITLPEGVTRNLRVTDAVPSGMQYVSFSVDTTGFNGTVTGTPTVTGGVSDGDDVVFNFGDVTTNADNVTTNNAFTLNITLRVLDVSGNQIGSVLTNSASLTYTPGTGSSDVSISGGSQNITVHEPIITTTKSVTPASGVQAGSTVTYTVRFTNTGTSTAYEVTAQDVLAQGVAYNNDAACTLFDGSTSQGIGVSVSISGGTLTFDGNPSGAWDIPAGGYIECTYTATAQSSLHLDGFHTNTIDADWSSLPGSDPNGRVYDDSVNRPGVDGTQDNASANFTSPAAAIAKSDNNTSGAVIGQVIDYTLTLTSPSGTLRNAIIRDTLPAGLIYVVGSQSVGSGISPAPTFTVSSPNDGSAAVTLEWNFDDAVISNSPVTITFQAQVANVAANQNGSERTNTVTLLYTTAEGTPVSRTASDSLTILEPELEILKTVSDSAPPPGGTVTYTLTVRHTSTSAAAAFDLTWSDLIPGGLSYVPGSLTHVSGVAPGTLNASPPNLTASWASLPLGSQSVLTYQLSVPPGSNGQSYDNTASIGWSSLAGTVNGERNDSGGVNDYTASAQASLTSTGPDLAIEKSDGGSSAVPGGVIVYTLTYRNNGNGAASGVVITETVPAHTTFMAGLSSPGWSCADGSVGGTTCTYTIGTLASGSNGTLTFAVRVDNPVPAGVTQIANTVSIGDDGSRGPDPKPGDNRASDTTPLTAAPDLAISKDDGVNTAQPGDLLSYTLTYRNNGNQTATGVVISETVPLHTTFVAGSSSPGWSCANGSVGGTTCTYTIGTLASGSSGTLTFAVRVDNPVPEGVTQIANTVSIADDGDNGPDPTPGDNTDSDTDELSAAPDLAISKDDGVNVTAPGATLMYTLRIENRGNQMATGVVVTDTLPVGVTFVSASDGATYEESTRLVTWPPFDLPAQSAAVTRTLTVQVNDPLSVEITSLLNTAVVRDDGQNGIDPTPDDNTATDENVIGQGGKAIVETNQDFTVLPQVAIGEILTYEVRFKVEAGQQIADLIFSDVLDEGLAFVACDEVNASAEGLVSSRGEISGLCTSAVISAYPPGSSEPQQRGRYMTLDFGNLNNPTEQDIDLIIRYRVVVLNSSANVRGKLLNNQAEWKWDGGSLSMQAREVRIVEPTLTVVKTVDPDVGLPGATVTFRLLVKADPASDTSAWDVLLTDTLPRGLTYVPGTLRFVSGLLPNVLDDSAAPLLRVGWEVFPPDAPETILAFEAEIGNLSPGDTVENVALLSWSSLPGVVQNPQSPYNPQSDERRFQPGSPLNTYGSQADVSISSPLLPDTGFAPRQVTVLPAQPAGRRYSNISGLWLEIPALGIRRNIVGVPLQEGVWDVTWLNNLVGWLEGSAYPTRPGNTVLTGHVYDANGLPGVFVGLHTLKWGDEILIRTSTATYRYQVREVRRVLPGDISALRHEERDWLTLITCQGYQEAQNRYQWRVVVRAVLIEVTP